MSNAIIFVDDQDCSNTLLSRRQKKNDVRICRVQKNPEVLTTVAPICILLNSFKNQHNDLADVSHLQNCGSIVAL